MSHSRNMHSMGKMAIPIFAVGATSNDENGHIEYNSTLCRVRHMYDLFHSPPPYHRFPISMQVVPSILLGWMEEGIPQLSLYALCSISNRYDLGVDNFFSVFCQELNLFPHLTSLLLISTSKMHELRDTLIDTAFHISRNKSACT